MPKRVWFRPAPGLTHVPKDPRIDPRKYFPPDGDWCEDSPYMQKRQMKGDGVLSDERPPPLVITEPPPSPPAEVVEAEEGPLKITPELARSTFTPIAARRPGRRRATPDDLTP